MPTNLVRRVIAGGTRMPTDLVLRRIVMVRAKITLVTLHGSLAVGPLIAAAEVAGSPKGIDL